MKTKELFLMSVLTATLNLVSVGQAPAQTFTSLGNLHGPFDNPIFLGNTVYAAVHGLVLSDDTFYGTEPGDRDTDYSGAVYGVGSDGTGFTVHNFSPISLYEGPYINADGAFPNAGLVLSGPTLYGTTYWGGSFGDGTIFSVSTNGTSFTVLRYGGDFVSPPAGWILSGNTIYGTSAGSVFALNTMAIVVTGLYNFTATYTNSLGTWTNRDGADVKAGLILSGDTLYGTASYGGAGGNGTVFAVNTDGTGFRVLHGFAASGTNALGVYTNSEGTRPAGGLALSGNTLYGTASQGGSAGSGTVFAVSTNGTDFTTLYSFTSISNSGSPAFLDTNSDGAFPQAPLALKGNTLYGTTSGGGTGGGTLFSISFQPQLTIVRSGPEFVLSWPTNVAGFDYTGFTLQCSTSVGSSDWTNCTSPVTGSGAYLFVTNPISANAQFFRLKR
jgi:uncharacterized repeat protein (TIGR03803 family)